METSVVKKALKRLEDDGILGSDRPRRPGFDVSAVRIADAFPAKAELAATLRACVEAWPAGRRCRTDRLDALTPKTKAHLRHRGLLDDGGRTSRVRKRTM